MATARPAAGRRAADADLVEPAYSGSQAQSAEQSLAPPRDDDYAAMHTLDERDEAGVYGGNNADNGNGNGNGNGGGKKSGGGGLLGFIGMGKKGGGNNGQQADAAPADGRPNPSADEVLAVKGFVTYELGRNLSSVGQPDQDGNVAADLTPEQQELWHQANETVSQLEAEQEAGLRGNAREDADAFRGRIDDLLQNFNAADTRPESPLYPVYRSLLDAQRVSFEQFGPPPGGGNGDGGGGGMLGGLPSKLDGLVSKITAAAHSDKDKDKDKDQDEAGEADGPASETGQSRQEAFNRSLSARGNGADSGDNGGSGGGSAATAAGFRDSKETERAFNKRMAARLPRGSRKVSSADFAIQAMNGDGGGGALGDIAAAPAGRKPRRRKGNRAMAREEEEMRRRQMMNQKKENAIYFAI